MPLCSHLRFEATRAAPKRGSQRAAVPLALRAVFFVQRKKHHARASQFALAPVVAPNHSVFRDLVEWRLPRDPCRVWETGLNRGQVEAAGKRADLEGRNRLRQRRPPPEVQLKK